MILSCSSCEKKFVVPDNAIGSSGRLVQCSSCGNKWKQFPVKINEKEELVSKSVAKQTTKKLINPKKPIGQKKLSSPKRKVAKKKREVNLYSPEYLAKKHGININSKPASKNISNKDEKNIDFGFYSILIILIIAVIAALRLLFFVQDYIVEILPIAEIYIDYLFESINILKDIIQNFFSNY